MSTTVEKIASNKVKLSFDVDSAKFDEAMGKAYLKVRNQVTIPGFRKGKAPRKMIENMYGEGVFYDEAFELIFDEVYGPAVDENKIEVVDRPEIEIQEIGAGKNLKFTCEVFVKPDVTLGEYKGVSVKKETTVVSDVEVDARVEEERNKQATEIQVEDRAVAEGDTVNLDYAGTVDGVAFAGGTAQDQTLKIGSGSFIPGFEEQMIGMNIGEEKDLQVTFPEKYHAEELAGKAAVFHVKVNSITETQLPALDDDFAKDISEFDTLEEYKADIRAKLEAQAAEKDNNNFTNAVIEKVLENATVEIPAVMIDRQVNYMLQDIAYRLSMSGISLEDYCKFSGSDIDSMRESYKPEAENRVKMQLVIEAVGKAENVACTDEELEADVAAYAEQNNTSVEEFKKQLAESDYDYLRDRKTAEKTIALIVDNAVFTEPKEAPEAEAPAAE